MGNLTRTEILEAAKRIKALECGNDPYPQNVRECIAQVLEDTRVLEESGLDGNCVYDRADEAIRRYGERY